MKRVLIMAGGTGGHIFPALAVAGQLRARGVEVLWLGTQRGLEAHLVPEAGIPLYRLPAYGLRGKRAYAWVLAPLWLGAAVLQALAIMLKVWPAAVLSMGGFVTGSGAVAAWILRRPLLLHEQNAVPGLTNRWLARLADRVMEGFPGSFPQRVSAVFIGNPVRPEITALPPPEVRFAGRLGNGGGALRVLVFGGSQGAQVLNEVLPEALAQLPPEQRPEVWHQTGLPHIARTRQCYRRAGVQAELTPFIKDMAEAYAWADLVVCRAGALTVAELAAAGVGAVLVPYPYAVDDHQTRNADYLVRAGGAVLLPQAQLSASRLSRLFQDLAEQRGRVLEMASCSRRLVQAQAAARAADLVLAVAGADEEATTQKHIKGSNKHA